MHEILNLKPLYYFYLLIHSTGNTLNYFLRFRIDNIDTTISLFVKYKKIIVTFVVLLRA